FSTELCGGTHVRRTGDIGLFKIVSEGAVAAGVRRIEALTGKTARHHLLNEEHLLFEAASTLKAAPQDVPSRIAQLVKERRKLERELAEARRALVTGGGNVKAGSSTTTGSGTVKVAGIEFHGQAVAVPSKELKPIVDDLKKKIGSGVIALVSTDEGKASLVVGVTEDLAKRISAVDLVRIGVAELGGKGGGGRPDMAQGGGPDAGSA